MTECHLRTNVMLKQPRIRASRSSPAQNLQGLRVIYSKNFSRATFFVFWGSHFAIDFWVICPWKKIEEKVQCVLLRNNYYNTIKLLNSLNIPSVSMDSNAPMMCRNWIFSKSWEFFGNSFRILGEFLGISLGDLWEFFGKNE